MSLDLNPSVDPTVFDPHIPEGARITRMKHGALSELANEVGLAVREPADLPAVWKPEPAVLSLCPPEEPVAGSGHWQVQWSYCLGDPTVENRLTFAATDRPPAEAVIGTPAEILPGVVGWYVNGRPSSELSSLSWSAKGIHYTIRDKTSAAGSNPYLSFKLDELVKLAREIMPGS